GQIPEITVRAAWQRLSDANSQPSALLIDVREAWEYTGEHAAGAVNLPLSALRAREGEVPRDRDILLICQVGQRSMMAARFLRQQGGERVFKVEGGTDAWETAQLPLER